MELLHILLSLCILFFIGNIYFALWYPFVFSIAFAISFSWVLFYGYSYKKTSDFKLLRLNIFTLFAWVFFLMVYYMTFEYLKNSFALASALAISGLLYYVGIFTIEWIGYHKLKIQLASSYHGLQFDAIHGPWYMKLYYMTAWIIFIGMTFLVKSLISQ